MDIQENRRKVVEVLRTTDLPQGREEFYNPTTGEYCALGIMTLVIGLDPRHTPWLALEEAYGIPYRRDAGPDSETVIYEMSDSGKSFREIGDHLAAIWGIA